MHFYLTLIFSSDFIDATMHSFASEGFEARYPDAKKIPRYPVTSLGPNDEWSGDGHDKLNKIGFGVYGIRDKASGKWLGLWVVPNNRLGEVVAYLYLCLVEELGGKVSCINVVCFTYHDFARHAASINNGLWFRDHGPVWVCKCIEVIHIN
jgi:hypothetical protein